MLDSVYHMIIKIIENSYFWRENVRGLLYIPEVVKASFHNVTRKSVNHLWFIKLNAMRYFTPRRDVI